MEEMTAIAFLTIVVIFSPFWMQQGALIVKKDLSVSAPILGYNGIKKDSAVQGCRLKKQGNRGGRQSPVSFSLYPIQAASVFSPST